jgi:hypothetical protein
MGKQFPDTPSFVITAVSYIEKLLNVFQCGLNGSVLTHKHPPFIVTKSEECLPHIIPYNEHTVVSTYKLQIFFLCCYDIPKYIYIIFSCLIS